jgi:DNA-directed RNA polymerase subunit RPC12/RpoP
MAAIESMRTTYRCAHCSRELSASAFPYVLPDKPKRPTRAHRCVDCVREYKRQYYLTHDGAKRERFRPADPAASAERKKARWPMYRALNLERVHAVEAAYRERKRAECNARIRAWKEANPHQASKHRVAKLRAIPAWADVAKIAEIYRLAQRMSRESGEPWHVDHVVPLNSPLVCGLHCEANLDAVPGRVNLSKKNRFWPDMP